MDEKPEKRLVSDWYFYLSNADTSFLDFTSQSPDCVKRERREREREEREREKEREREERERD